MGDARNRKRASYPKGLDSSPVVSRVGLLLDSPLCPTYGSNVLALWGEALGPGRGGDGFVLEGTLPRQFFSSAMPSPCDTRP